MLEDLHLKTEAFTNMKNLRLLQINSAHLTGSYEHLSKKLKWFCWHKCPLKFLPHDFHLENLVILDMQHCKVEQVWKKKKILNNLKVLNLSNSKCLTKSPNFSQVPQLEILILEGCTSLVQVHESIGYLKRLVLLNLKNCTNLKVLPRSICNLKSLETLDLSGCSVLEKLPKYMGDMMDLTKLPIDQTAIKKLPSSFGVCKNLKYVSLYGCSSLTELPNFLQAPHLECLVLEGCTSLVEIHESIGHLKRLILLDLQRCENLRNLPNNISKLESLETLDLSKCFNLEKLPEQLGNMTALTELFVDNTAIKKLPSSFSLLKNLETLSLRGCECLIELPEFLQTSRLETLILEDCTSLVEVHKSIGLLKRLVCLSLGGCKKLKNLPNSISNLELLETLVLSDCLELNKLPEQLGNMMALKELLADRTTIEQLPSSFGLLRNLGIVRLSGCGGPPQSWISLKSSIHINLLVSISGLCSLTKLDLSDRNLSEDEFPIELGCLSSLRELVLSRNNFLNLPSCINYLPALSDLFVNECTTLQSISLPISLQLLEANGCTSLERILILTNKSLGSFYLNNCHKLVEIQSLNSVQCASNVLMGRCNNLAYDFRKSILQMLCKTDSSSLCLPGSEIPNWFSHQTIGSLISFHVPSFLDGKMGKVLVCVVYAANKEVPRVLDLQGWFDWTFCNKTKNPQESYKIESRNCYFDSFEDHIFLAMMQFHHINLEMKSGDEIELSIDLGDQSQVKKCEIQVKKCGIHLLVDEPNVIDEDGGVV
ncbi:disease resistance protein RPV1-like isoform X2 [Corylus avellana]|nr:disease resistance protein RPV1-like isoform X2 [Corylus avellana]